MKHRVLVELHEPLRPVTLRGAGPASTDGTEGGAGSCRPPGRLRRYPQTGSVGEAGALGLAPADVAKTLMARTPEGHLRALVPASERLDMEAARGPRRVEGRRAARDRGGNARVYPEFALGAVPTLGGSHTDPVIVDRRLARREWLVFEAGSHDDSVRIRTDDVT